MTDAYAALAVALEGRSLARSSSAVAVAVAVAVLGSYTLPCRSAAGADIFWALRSECISDSCTRSLSCATVEALVSVDCAVAAAFVASQPLWVDQARIHLYLDR